MQNSVCERHSKMPKILQSIRQTLISNFCCRSRMINGIGVNVRLQLACATDPMPQWNGKASEFSHQNTIISPNNTRLPNGLVRWRVMSAVCLKIIKHFLLQSNYMQMKRAHTDDTTMYNGYVCYCVNITYIHLYVSIRKNANM